MKPPGTKGCSWSSWLLEKLEVEDDHSSLEPSSYSWGPQLGIISGRHDEIKEKIIIGEESKD